MRVLSIAITVAAIGLLYLFLGRAFAREVDVDLSIG